MRRSFRWLALLLAVAPLAAFQRATSPPASGLILGQVVDGTNGRGVSGVIVSLSAATPPARPTAELVDLGTVQPSAPLTRVLTSDDGRFLFRDLPKGRYALTTAAPGFVPSSYGQGRPNGPAQAVELDVAQKVGGITIRVWKFASVSGVIADENGEPAVGVSVRTLRRVIAGGKPRFGPMVTATTDDRGMYRIAGLMPGDYAVGVTFNHETVPMAAAMAYADASQSGTPNNSAAYRSLTNSLSASMTPSGFRVGDLVLQQQAIGLARPAPAADGRIMAYPTQFYPAAPTPSQASLVTLKAGEERNGVDLQLRLVPAVRVSGRVTGPDGPGAFLAMTLVPPTGTDFQSEGVAEAASGATDATGAFTFLGVPAGQYVLKIRMYPRALTPPATTTMTSAPNADGTVNVTFSSGRGGAAPPPGPPPEPTLWAIVPVSVGTTDVNDLAVTLRHGLVVSGRVEFAGAKPPATDAIQRMSISLQSAEGRTSAPIAATGRATADGSFRTAGFPAGRYIVAVTTMPPGWTLKSAVLAGRDVSVEPLELGDTDVGNVIITLTDQATEISGTVTGAKGPDANAEVIVFPADSSAWREIGLVARRGRNERVSRTGTFAATGLPPGEYFVAAVPIDRVAEWNDPKFLDTLTTLATRVTLADGEKKVVNLKTTTVR